MYQQQTQEVQQQASTESVGNLPEKKFVAGGISATIWNNVGRGGNGPVNFQTVQFQRTYKDTDGNWKTSNSLRINDLPKAMVVLQKAYEYLALKDSQAEQ